MSADSVAWEDEYVLDHRRRMRTAAFVSLAVHACVAGVFAIAPAPTVEPLPASISVDLIAAPARPAPRAAAPPAAAPRAPAPPPAAAPSPPTPPAVPPPAPVVPPAPAPPVVKAPVEVLPEETPGRIRKAKPEPAPTVEKPPPAPKPAEPKPKPKPRPAPPPPVPAEPAYADDESAMAALMEELGGDDVSEMLSASAEVRAQREAAEAAEAAAAESSGGPGGATRISPEQLAWDRRVTQLIARNFPVPPRYRGRGLVARVEINVGAGGGIVGEPRLVGFSGDLDFDRWAMSAVLKAASLIPPPPAPGLRRLDLRSEER
jgi:outer membrane biosynthesis protein TonB